MTHIKGRTDGARISTLNKTDKLFNFYYEDAKTLYEVFLKGGKLSSKFNLTKKIYSIKSFK